MNNFYHLNYPAENVFQCCADLVQEMSEDQRQNLIILPEIAMVYVDLTDYPAKIRGQKVRFSFSIKVERAGTQACTITISTGMILVYGMYTSGQLEGCCLHATAYFMQCLLGRLNYLYPHGQG